MQRFGGSSSNLRILAPFVAILILAATRRSDIMAAILFGVALVPALLGQAYGLAVLQGLQRFAYLNTVRALPAALYAGLAILLLALGDRTLVAVTLAFLVANLIGAAAMLAPIVRKRARSRTVAWRPLTAFGVRSWLGSVSPMETLRFDQVVVVTLFQPSVVGIYVVGLAFANLPRLVGWSVGLIAYPKVASMPGRRDRKIAVVRYTAATLAFTAPLVMAIAFMAEGIITWFFGQRYVEAAGLVGPLVLSGWFAGGRRTMTDAARGAGLHHAGNLAELGAWIAFAASVWWAFDRLTVSDIAIAMVIGSGSGLAILAAFILRHPADHVDEGINS